MTTNKPKIVAWLRNERGEHARGPATFDPMCIFGSPEPQGLAASYSPVVMFSDYEALQAECEKLRAAMIEAKGHISHYMYGGSSYREPAAKAIALIDAAMQEAT